MHRSGFFPRLALVNLLRNGRYYGPYLLSCGGTAAMYYILCYLTTSEIVDSVRGAGYLQSLMYLGCIVVALFSVVLLLYANSFVMKRRQRELSLYNILGLEKRHIAHVMFYETLFCAIAVIAGGIVAGVLLSKIVLLLLLKLAHIPAQFGFEFSLSGAVTTAALFAVLFLLTLFCNLIRLGRTRPIELLHSDRTGEREPKTKRLIVVIGLLTLGGGYFLSWKVRQPEEALVLFFLAVLLVMIGTYCLFTAGSIALLKRLRANSGYYYQVRHFTAVSGLLYRMKQNAVGLANICILSTMVLVTVSTTLCLYVDMEDSIEQMYPYDVQVVQYLTGYDKDEVQPPPEETLTRVKENLAASGRTASHFAWLTRVEGTCEYSGNTFQWDQMGVETRLRMVTAEDYARCTGQTVELGKDQVIAYAEGIDLPNPFYIGEMCLWVADRMETDLPVNGSAIVSSDNAAVTIVVADQTVMEEIQAQSSVQIFSEKFLIQINLDGTEEEKRACAGLLVQGTRGSVAVNSRQENALDLYAMYGGFLFLGVFLGLLFLAATTLIIYYKQVSEGYEDQRRYRILRQVGMTGGEIRASIRSQILIVFFLPLAAAALHTAAAYPMVSKLLKLFQLTSTGRYALCTVLTLAVFCAVYAVVYGLTARGYWKIVS